MQRWNLYFLIKLGLHITGQISLSPLWNILLFVLLLASNPNTRHNNPLLKGLRDVVFIGPAIALLLHESGLVISWALLEQMNTLLNLSISSLWELFKRSIPAWIIWGSLACYILILVLDRYMRISTWVACGLIAVLFQTLNFTPTKLPQTIEIVSEPLLRGRENRSPAELVTLGQEDFQKLREARNQENVISMPDPI